MTSIINKYKNLIYKIAIKIRGCNNRIDFNDLIQSGYEALIRAEKLYDKTKGIKEITYYTTAIKRRMYQEFNSITQPIKISRYITDRNKYLFEARKRYNSEEDIINYIKDNTCLSDSAINTMINQDTISKTLAMTNIVENKIIDNSYNIDDKIDRELKIKLIRHCFKFLTKQEKEVLYYHLFINKPLSLDEIAKLLNTTKTTVLGRYKLGIKHLRKRITSKLEGGTKQNGLQQLRKQTVQQ